MPRGAVWRVATDPAAAEGDWTAPDYDDAGWPRARAPLGFGEDDLATEIPPPAAPDQTAVFLRHAFEVASLDAVSGLVLALRRDDGVRLLLNGREILRSNLPGGAIDATTEAPLSIGGDDEERYLRLDLSAELLVPGRNVLAASLHNTRAGHKDLAFDLALGAATDLTRPAILRGPYLQRAGAGEVVVRWTTNVPNRGRVRWGTRPEQLLGEALSEGFGRSHEVTLGGLAPGTRYFYAVGWPEGDLAGGDHRHAFTTLPPAGAHAPVRLWVTGDQGTGNEHARRVRDAALRFAGSRPPHVWITLGDNAYPSGTPSDYQAHFFDVYGALLRHVPVFPALGNHDYNGVDPVTGKTAFFELFTLPEEGENGGVPSGSEAYYAFDAGNVHLVALDSDRGDLTPKGPMLTWLREDLAQRRGDWLVAYLHHTPFSRGSHWDDDEQRSRLVRAHLVPLLEEAGADLVLSGHSHAYERSFLLRGPHPEGFHAEAASVVDPGDGRPRGGGPYRKGEGGMDGTVYAVVGSSGQLGKGPLDHPAMAASVAAHGSLVLDADGCRLDAAFVSEDGEVLDAFAIEKGVPCGG